MTQNKALSMLGLAMKAGKIASGEYQVLEAVRAGTAWCVLVAEDASDNTRKLYTDKCTYYEVPVFVYGTKEELGRTIGKDLRSAVAVCDEGLSKAVVAAITKASTERSNGGKHGEN